jgi:hypothetical protein
LHLVREYPLPEKPVTLQRWVSEKNNPEDPQVVEATEFFEKYGDKGVLQSSSAGAPFSSFR